MTLHGAQRTGRGIRITALLAVLTAALGLSPSHATSASDDSAPPTGQDWVWPVSPFRTEAPYVQPAHRYGAGHRGVDLRPLDGFDVRSPADGIVAFSGPVAERGVLTIVHDGGLVTTLEPVVSMSAPGDAVARGEVVAELSVGGHASSGTLHVGVRRDGEYINPLLLLGDVPRAVLLPCC